MPHGEAQFDFRVRTIYLRGENTLILKFIDDFDLQYNCLPNVVSLQLCLSTL